MKLVQWPNNHKISKINLSNKNKER